MARLISIVLCLVLVGCGSKKEDDKADRKGKAAAPAVADPAALFTGKAPALPDEIAKARLGGAKADVLKAVGAESGYVPSKVQKDVTYDLKFDAKTEKLEEISVKADTNLEPILTKQWGAPVKNDARESYWFAPETGLRAWLPKYGRNETVTFTRYEPIAKGLGGPGFDLAFAAGKPLFGATLDELKAAWGATLCDFDDEAPRMKEAFEENAKDSIASLRDVKRELAVCRELPRTVETGTPGRDKIRIGVDARAFAIRMVFPVSGSPELRQQLVSELDAKFGKAVEVKWEKNVQRGYFDPAAKLQAIASIGEQSVVLEVGPYLSVAELLGGDKPGLSIETASMIGGTFEQIQKEDPTHFRQSGELAALIYPPTEFSAFQTDIGLHRFANAKKTHQYTVVLHDNHRPGAGDEVLALLKQKYGDPKPSKAHKSTETDQYWDFAKLGRKVQARRVSEQWQLTYSK
ncbi:MAG: hypothetical protein H0T89_30570 [Deltaproteobacteria bacterium]|nr:hypothetical protein [Deltaproteobacteria bacterium]MDQ3299812.1 hypothetical protein [Myxococcota bacterium]